MRPVRLLRLCDSASCCCGCDGKRRVWRMSWLLMLLESAAHCRARLQPRGTDRPDSTWVWPPFYVANHFGCVFRVKRKHPPTLRNVDRWTYIALYDTRDQTSTCVTADLLCRVASIECSHLMRTPAKTRLNDYILYVSPVYRNQ